MRVPATVTPEILNFTKSSPNDADVSHSGDRSKRISDYDIKHVVFEDILSNDRAETLKKKFKHSHFGLPPTLWGLLRDALSSAGEDVIIKLIRDHFAAISAPPKSSL